ncbi:hypothetical protein IV102_20670 [bacterium]|nr:hypothetical protein [bacterium]
MDGLYDSLQALQVLLKSKHIESAAIGALAVAAWGVARLTSDVDVKVSVHRDEAELLLSTLKERYTPLLQDDPAWQIRQSGLLFLRDAGGHRIDVMLCDTSFDVAAIERAQDLEVRPGLVVRVCSPEDLIVYKLVSTRARDHEDAQSVIRRQGHFLDETYVVGWLQQFEAALDDSTLVEAFRAALRRSRKKT